MVWRIQEGKRDFFQLLGTYLMEVLQQEFKDWGLTYISMRVNMPVHQLGQFACESSNSLIWLAEILDIIVPLF